MVQRAAAYADISDKRRPALKSVHQEAAGPEIVAPAIAPEDARAQIEARVQGAYDEAMARLTQEVAEPAGWWNLYAFGPIQAFGVPGPLPPHQVIKVGETAFVGTVMVLNPFLTLAPGMTPLSVLSNFALPYEVRYQTGNLSTWSLGPGALNVVHSGPGQNLIPGVAFYVDVLAFSATTPGLYEMNISARLLGAAPPFVNAPQFAGYARQVLDLDAESLFFPFLPSTGTPGFQFDQPIRFQVYP
jgi:hypothetical protein